MDEVMVEDTVEDAGTFIPDVQTEITLGDPLPTTTPEEDNTDKVATGKDVLLPLSEAPPPPKRRNRGARSEASDESTRTRSSARSSRKKQDPDFDYSALSFAGTRKRAAKSPASVSPASGGKRVAVEEESKVGSATSDSVSVVSQDAVSSGSGQSDPYSMENLEEEVREENGKEQELKPPPEPSPVVVETPEIVPEIVPEKAEERPKREAASRRVSAVEEDSDSSNDADNGIKQTKLYCICKKPYGNRFMISCDKCEEWYHGHCVGVTKNQGKNLSRRNLPWFCPPCRRKNSALSNAIPSVPVEPQTPPVAITSPTIVTEASPTAEKEVPSSDKEREDELTSLDTTSGTTGASEKQPVKEVPAKVKKTKVEKRKAKEKKELARGKVRPMKGELKEFIQRQKSKEARHDKKVEEKKEEKPLPVEADFTGLRLTALGKPRLEYKQKRPSLPIAPPPPKNNRPQLFSADTTRPSTTPAEPRTPTTPTTPRPSPGSSQRSTPDTRPKIRRHHCIVCKAVAAREHSLYCSSKCIHQHGLLAMRAAKSTEAVEDRIAVREKHGGRELTGENAPLRNNIVAFLEGHQTFYVSIPEEGMVVEELGEKGRPQDDPGRAMTKMMLKDHLTNRCREAPDLQDITPSMISRIVDEIEAGLFHHFKDTGSAYKRKYRTIVMNINDKKNENFFRRILRKEIHPDKVVDLTPEQMASDSMAQWRQNEIKKELDMLIQTQTEDIDARPNIKKTHKGEEPIEEEFLSQDREKLEDSKPDEDAEKSSPVDIKSNFSPAILASPTGNTFPSSTVSPHESSESPHTDKLKSPEGGPARRDTTAEHEEHIFDANCRICTSSLPGFSRDLDKYSSALQNKIKEEEKKAEQPARLFYGPRAPVTYSSPSTASFRVPEDSPSGKRSRFSRSTDASPNASSPQSSTSDFSPDADEDAKAAARGVIWQGEVDTYDLPIVKLEAFAMYGRAEEAMKEIPKKVRQLGRIQPGQLWPYIEQVKPLKEMALVVLKPPPGRVSSEFNSYHYFLTTRGRVAVIGPLTAAFKDFYVIALKEDEALPEGLKFPEGIVFDTKHPKIFLGIIVFHAALRIPLPTAPTGRGIFDVPTLPAVAPPRVANYVSPKTPDSAENSPNINRTTADPIVGKFLTIPKQASPDTSEPMDIEEDAPSLVPKAPEVSKAPEVKPVVPPVSVAPKKVTPADLLKVMDSLPSIHQGALKEVVKNATAKPAVPVDPRLARMSKPAVAEPQKEVAAPVFTPITVPPPNVPYTPISVPPPSLLQPHAAPAPQEKEDDGFGFSQKFIENLSRIQLPAGLKEALKSISVPGEAGSVAAPPVSTPVVLPPIPPGGSLLGPGPSGPLLGPAPLNIPPPGYAARPPNLNQPPPGFGQPPPGFRGPFPPFPPRGPPPGGFPGDFRVRPPFRPGPEEHGEFRARGPPDQRRERGERREREENGRWTGPARPERREERPERWSAERRVNRIRERSSERKERSARVARKSRSRSRSPVARRRSYRSKSKSRSRERERRVRSRSRSPRRREVARRKDDETGVDEFGRDITLRKKVHQDEVKEETVSSEERQEPKVEKEAAANKVETEAAVDKVEKEAAAKVEKDAAATTEADGSEPVTP